MKKYFLTTVLFVGLFMLVSSKAFAHCIWAEVPSRVDLNSEFSVNA